MSDEVIWVFLDSCLEKADRGFADVYIRVQSRG